MSDTLPIAAIALATFGVKVAATGSLAAALASRLPDRISAWLTAWTLILAAQVIWVLAASAVGLLNPVTMWLFLIAVAALAIASGRHWATQTMSAWLQAPGMSRSAVIIAVVLFAGLFVRATLLSDFTHDAFTYGHVRLALWKNYGSVLVLMPTEQINIFSNEWNGELIALTYGLTTNDLQGFNYGNVEVLLTLLLGSSWLAFRLGSDTKFAFTTGLACSITPAALGLASTAKGDLLACAGIVMAAGWSTVLFESKYRFWSVSMVLASLGLAVGAKVSAVFGAAVIALALLYSLTTAWRDSRTYWGIALGTTIACIMCSRYLINYVQYGDPLSRAGGESATPGFQTLIESLRILGPQFWRFFPEAKPYDVWALSGGLGLSGVAAGAAALTGLASIRHASRRRLLLGGAVVVGLGITFSIIPPRVWGFRYALPLVVVGVVVITSSLTATRWRRIALAMFPIVAAVNIIMTLRPGEVVPDLSKMGVKWLSQTATASSLERAHALNRDAFAVAGVDRFGLDAPEGTTLVIRNQIDVPILAFVGSSAQNRLVLTSTLAEFEAGVREHQPRFAVIRTREAITEPERELLRALRYSLRTQSAPYVAERD